MQADNWRGGVGEAFAPGTMCHVCRNQRVSEQSMSEDALRNEVYVLFTAVLA